MLGNCFVQQMKKVFKVTRFSDVKVKYTALSGQSISPLRLSSKCDQKRRASRRRLSERFSGRIAVHAWHIDIDENYVRVERRCQIERLLPTLPPYAARNGSGCFTVIET